ncbi:MAG TPA: twin-arginine translocase TatA/TatE family subunit [Polyangiaceae bacterium]|nr:twin-arginine translocase TatA/TatE family subunit [Polyangiaceae bacterium]
MFGVSFPELVVLGTVALLVLGPEKLPGMLRTMGQWIAKLRRLTTEVRYQSGIDEVLRAEGFDGGLNELRSIMRGGPAMASHSATIRQPTPEAFVSDKSREYPAEGPDAYGALPEDLVSPASPAATLPPGEPVPALPAGAATAELPPAAGDDAAAPAELPTAALTPDAHATSSPVASSPVASSSPAPEAKP